MSHLTDGIDDWDDAEKRELIRLIWDQATFAGIRLGTFCVMDNHFHVLVEVPEALEIRKRFRGPEGEVALYGHLLCLHSEKAVERTRNAVRRFREQHRHDEAQRILDSFLNRMGDLSIWAKEVKEKFARYLNRKRKRRGPVWMDRYRNVLVEGASALPTVASYVDLNPVAAGVTERPENYPWSGYGEASRAEERSIVAITRMVGFGPSASWNETVRPLYASWLAEAQDHRESRRDARKEGGQTHRSSDAQPIFFCRYAAGGEAWVKEIIESKLRVARSDGARPPGTSLHRWVRILTTGSPHTAGVPRGGPAETSPPGRPPTGPSKEESAENVPPWE